MKVVFTVLTYCCIFVVSCSFRQAHCVLADLCSLSLRQLSQTGHSSATQQQVRAGQVNLHHTTKGGGGGDWCQYQDEESLLCF